MPFYDPNLNVLSTIADWPLGSDPTLTWTEPVGPVDHFRVWVNTVADWTTATDVSGPLPDGTLSFLVVGEPRDLTPRYWWVLAYDATELYSGYNYGTDGYQNTWIEIGDVTLGTQYQEPVPIPAQTGGKFRSTGIFAFTSSLCKNGYTFLAGQPNHPVPDYASFTIVCDVIMGGHSNSVAGPFFPAQYGTVDWKGTAGVGQIGPGGNGSTIPALAPHTDPVSVQHSTVGAGQTYIFLTMVFGGVGAPIPNAGGINCGVLNAANITANVSYVGPGASDVFGPAGPGGSNVVPVPPPPPLKLIRPVYTPLPCIPCCRTAAPICECRTEGQLSS